jgi:hypothetical protein
MYDKGEKVSLVCLFFICFQKMNLNDEIYLAGRFVTDLANCMTREEIVELARKLRTLKSCEEVEPCGFTDYVVARIIERHYEVTDSI